MLISTTLDHTDHARRDVKSRIWVIPYSVWSSYILHINQSWLIQNGFPVPMISHQRRLQSVQSHSLSESVSVAVTVRWVYWYLFNLLIHIGNNTLRECSRTFCVLFPTQISLTCFFILHYFYYHLTILLTSYRWSIVKVFLCVIYLEATHWSEMMWGDWFNLWNCFYLLLLSSSLQTTEIWSNQQTVIYHHPYFKLEWIIIFSWHHI